jgi:hypothetical protein
VDKCQACLAPIFFARFKAGGNRVALDVRPVLEGDIVLKDGQDYAKVTTASDPEAIYKRHVCKRKRPT